MKNYLTRLWASAAVCAAVMCIASCGKGNFKVEGSITDAADSVLYLENMALDGPQKVDSVTLTADGNFSFSEEAPAGVPEFYRLRIGQQIVNFAVDTVATVNVKASYPTMASAYTIEGGDDNQRIRELALKQIDLQAHAKRVVDAPDLSANAVGDSVLALVDKYKEQVMSDYIDVKPISAVATSWDVYYPGSLRGENLHNIAIEAMKTRRIVQAEQQGITIDASKVTETDIIDIVLPDNKGVTRRLTDLKGQVVLLDFHVFAAQGSRERIMALRELYNKYHSRGLEIYQVSLDEDEHFWKTQVAALPWISVHDDGSRTQIYLSQAQTLPLDYIISRANIVVLGPRQIKNLEADIAAQL